MKTYFADFDLSDFWEGSDYATGNYVYPPPTEESIAAAENELGYKLPASYIELMRVQNGGVPKRVVALGACQM